jgi:hypothetical protein
MTSDEAAAVLAKLEDADKRVAEFAAAHAACGGKADLQGSSGLTIVRCSVCGAMCEVAGLDVELYVAYLEKFKGATDIERILLARGSDRLN